MKKIDLVASKLTVDLKTFSITYETNVDAEPGLIVLTDVNGEHDMMLCTQVHNGGRVNVKMKPVRVPAKRYEVGDQIGSLIIFE